MRLAWEDAQQALRSLALESEFQSRGTFNLICCTSTICDEVANGLTQRQISSTYAMAIKSDAQGADKPDWLAINQAILARWKMSGLERIKKRAFDILAGKIQP